MTLKIRSNTQTENAIFHNCLPFLPHIMSSAFCIQIQPLINNQQQFLHLYLGYIHPISTMGFSPFSSLHGLKRNIKTTRSLPCTVQQDRLVLTMPHQFVLHRCGDFSTKFQIVLVNLDIKFINFSHFKQYKISPQTCIWPGCIIQSCHKLFSCRFIYGLPLSDLKVGHIQQYLSRAVLYCTNCKEGPGSSERASLRSFDKS